MDIRIKRAYDEPARNDGYRVLVDRIWPRGVSKDEVQIDQWMKDVAPSNELRKWFGHQTERWEQFQRRYRDELEEKMEIMHPLLDRLRQGKRITLVFAAKDRERNNALVLRDFLGEKLESGE